MALSPVEHSIRAGVFFAGFRSDTYTLQGCGWKIAVSTDDYRGETSTMVLKHEGHGIVAHARCRDFHRRMMSARDPRRAMRMGEYDLEYEVEQMGRGVVVRSLGSLSDFSAMHLIDATPGVHMVEDFDLFDLPAFKPMIAQPAKEDLIVDPADVSAMLDMIRRQQSSGQAEIRERARRREIVPIQHAAIYTLPLAA